MRLIPEAAQIFLNTLPAPLSKGLRLRLVLLSWQPKAWSADMNSSSASSSSRAVKLPLGTRVLLSVGLKGNISLTQLVLALTD